jgi:hypothetical protein
VEPQCRQSNALDRVERPLALLGPDRFPKDPAEQTDVVAKRRVLIESRRAFGMVRVLANVLNLPQAQHEGERRPLAQRGASPFFSTLKRGRETLRESDIRFLPMGNAQTSLATKSLQAGPSLNIQS